MKNKQVFFNETRRMIKKIFWILFVILILIWMADIMTGDDHSLIWNTRIWYFIGIMIYIIGGVGIALEADEDNIHSPIRHWLAGLLFINILFIIISIIGLIINFCFSLFHWFGFFSLLPLSIQTILGWPSIVGALIFMVLTVGFSVIKEDALPTEDYQ